MTENQFSTAETLSVNKSMVMDILTLILVDLGIPKNMIEEHTLIHAHLGLDSVEIVKLALELKRKFDINLNLGTRQDFTLSEICQIVIVPLSSDLSD